VRSKGKTRQRCSPHTEGPSDALERSEFAAAVQGYHPVCAPGLVLAVAHAMLVAAYHILARRTTYLDASVRRRADHITSGGRRRHGHPSCAELQIHYVLTLAAPRPGPGRPRPAQARHRAGPRACRAPGRLRDGRREEPRAADQRDRPSTSRVTGQRQQPRASGSTAMAVIMAQYPDERKRGGADGQPWFRHGRFSQGGMVQTRASGSSGAGSGTAGASGKHGRRCSLRPMRRIRNDSPPAGLTRRLGRWRCGSTERRLGDEGGSRSRDESATVRLTGRSPARYSRATVPDRFGRVEGSGMKCLRCQHENRPTARFCEDCANPFNGPGPTTGSDAHLKTEVESLRRALTEALEQQTATGDILRVISRAPTDVQPVFASLRITATPRWRRASITSDVFRRRSRRRSITTSICLSRRNRASPDAPHAARQLPGRSPGRFSQWRLPVCRKSAWAAAAPPAVAHKLINCDPPPIVAQKSLLSNGGRRESVWARGVGRASFQRRSKAASS
jgi:hypothetical protein